LDRRGIADNICYEVSKRLHRPRLQAPELVEVTWDIPGYAQQVDHNGRRRVQARKSDDAPPAVKDIRSTKQIFADSADLESSAGASIRLGQPTLSNEPVFSLQASCGPWALGVTHTPLIF
jgi:hypothetical protein